MNFLEYKTAWAKKLPPYGAFDDYVILEVASSKERFLMRPAEFDFLARQLHMNCWEKKKSKYIQMLREWNECTGFADLEERPSPLFDLADTIEALKLLEGCTQLEYSKMADRDLHEFVVFLERNQEFQIVIRME